VAEMIGAELCLKAVRGMPERCGHYSCVCDDEVERLAYGQQLVGTGAHAG